MGSLCSGVQGAFSGSQTKTSNDDSTQHAVNTGATNTAGATASTTDPRLKAFADWAATSGQTAFQPAQGLVLGSAGAVNNDWQKYLTPFAGQQIQANMTAMQPQIQDFASKIKGDASANPYASSTNGALSRFYGQVAGQQGQMAAGVNIAAYTQALDAAQKDAARALQAGQTSGSLTTQQLGLYPSLIGAGGQTTSGLTNTTGSSSGMTDTEGHNVGTQTTKNTPSIASTLGTVAGIVGDALPFLPFATGSGVKSYDTGGAVKAEPSSFHGKVEDAFHAFHRMRLHAQNGGKAKGYDDGGWVPTVTPDTSADDSIINAANYNQGRMDATPPGMGLMDRARGILGAFGKMGMQSQSPGTGTTNVPGAAQPERRSLAADAAAARNPALEALQSQMSRTYDAGGRVGYADGGVGDWLSSLAKSLTPNSPFAPADSPTATRLRDDYGVDPRAMYSRSRNLVSDLASIDPMVPGHSGPLTGISKRMADENAAAFKGADILHNDAVLRGKFASGAPTMAGEMHPLDLRLKKAQVAEAEEELPINRNIRDIMTNGAAATSTPKGVGPAALPRLESTTSAPLQDKKPLVSFKGRETSQFPIPTSDVSDPDAKASAAARAGVDVAALAPKVAKIEQTAEGPIAVDANSKPLFNIAREIQLANAMSASKRYAGTGTAKLKLLDTMMNQGIQPDTKGGVLPIEGYAEAQARKEGIKKEATFPYEYMGHLASQAGRPTILKPGETAITGGEINPDIAAVAQLAKSKIPGMATAAPPPSAGAPAPPSTEYFPTGVYHNPAGGVSPQLSPEMKSLQEDAGKEFLKSQDNYRASTNVLMRLASMEDKFRNINSNDPSMLTSGTLAGTRFEIAKAINSGLDAFGVQPEFRINPEKVADYESLQKDATRLGFELVRTLGSREAASVVNQGVASVPSIGNSIKGSMLVLNSIRQAAQRDVDFYNYQLDYLKNNKTTVGADRAFNVAMPPTLYAERAKAMSQYDIPGGAVEMLQHTPPGKQRDERAAALNAWVKGKGGPDDIAHMFLGSVR